MSAPRLLSLLAAVLIVVASSRADELPSNVFVTSPEDEVQDGIFLGEAHPVFIRFHVRTEQGGHRIAWGDFVIRLHHYLDRNDDGVLTVQEAELGPWQDQLLRSPFVGGRRGTNNRTTQANLDVNPKDGKISFGELAHYLRTSIAFGEVSLEQGLPPDPKSTAIFGHLDLNHDGKLTADEMADVDSSFNRLDLDEDELLSMNEMEPYQNIYAAQFEQPSTALPFTVETMPVVLLPVAGSTEPLAKRLVNKYGRDPKLDSSGPRAVSEADLAIDHNDFQQADRDGDGELTASELESLLCRPPLGLEIVVYTGKRGSSQPRIELVKSSRPAPGLAIKSRTGENGTVFIEVDDTELELQAFDSIPNVGMFIERQFQSSDGDKNGYLDMKEAEANGFIQQFFQIADRDGDGKLFEKELKSFFAQQNDAIESHLSLTVSDGGRGLFDVIDANHDQFLSVRELRNSREWVKSRDRNGDGMTSLNELPRRYKLNLGRGQLPNRRAIFVNQPMAQRPSGQPNGLSWFQKMDRNHDGDVSLREFLGPREEFQRFDTDGDGLIDSKEAAGMP